MDSAIAGLELIGPQGTRTIPLRSYEFPQAGILGIE